MKEDLTLSLSLLWTSKLDSEDGSRGRKKRIALWMRRKVGTRSKEREKNIYNRSKDKEKKIFDLLSEEANR